MIYPTSLLDLREMLCWLMEIRSMSPTALFSDSAIFFSPNYNSKIIFSGCTMLGRETNKLFLFCPKLFYKIGYINLDFKKCLFVYINYFLHGSGTRYLFYGEWKKHWQTLQLVLHKIWWTNYISVKKTLLA